MGETLAVEGALPQQLARLDSERLRCDRDLWRSLRLVIYTSL
jgi:hypothetical protein